MLPTSTSQAAHLEIPLIKPPTVALVLGSCATFFFDFAFLGGILAEYRVGGDGWKAGSQNRANIFLLSYILHATCIKDPNGRSFDQI